MHGSIQGGGRAGGTVGRYTSPPTPHLWPQVTKYLSAFLYRTRKLSPLTHSKSWIRRLVLSDNGVTYSCMLRQSSYTNMPFLTSFFRSMIIGTIPRFTVKKTGYLPFGIIHCTSTVTPLAIKAVLPGSGVVVSDTLKIQNVWFIIISHGILHFLCKWIPEFVQLCMSKFVILIFPQHFRFLTAFRFHWINSIGLATLITIYSIISYLYKISIFDVIFSWVSQCEWRSISRISRLSPTGKSSLNLNSSIKVFNQGKSNGWEGNRTKLGKTHKLSSKASNRSLYIHLPSIYWLTHWLTLSA